MDKPVRVEVSMSAGSEQVMFTLVYADGYRTAYWKSFWLAIPHTIKLIWRGLNVVDGGL